MFFNKREDTGLNRAATIVEKYLEDAEFHEIKVVPQHNDNGSVSLLLEMKETSKILANTADFAFSAWMSEANRSLGFTLGQLSVAAAKPRSVEITENCITAPNETVLETYVSNTFPGLIPQKGRG